MCSVKIQLQANCCARGLYQYSGSRLREASLVVTSYSLTVQDGASPLYIASQYGHTAVVNILLEAGADVHQATTQV